MRIVCIILFLGGEGVTFREIERIILNDGWYYKNTKGSHNHYKHPSKPGKITIPKHSGDLDRKTVQSILKQAGVE